MNETPVRASRRTHSRARRHRPWWRGGSSVRLWNGEVLGWAVIGLGIGILAGAGLSLVLGGIWGTLALWISLVGSVVLAFRRGVPRGLLSFRAVDVLYGVVLGALLRIAQGWLAVAFGGSGALPSYPSLDGSLPPLWWADDFVAGGVIAPVVEEFFFRGLLLVALFSVVRRFVRGSASGQEDVGIVLGGVVAVAASTGLFVLTHQLVTPLSADVALTLGLLGLVTGMLVVFTGRIWPAVLVHAVFNLTGVGLTVVGTLVG